MPVLAIRNAGELKNNIGWWYDEVAKENWLTALRVLVYIKRDIAKYYTTRGEDFKCYMPFIDEVEIALKSGFGEYRVNNSFDKMRELIDKLRSDRILNLSQPFELIRSIYNRMQEDLHNVLKTGEPDDLELLRQDIADLTNPKVEEIFNKLKESGDTASYDMYSKILQFSGQAMGSIMRITPNSVINPGTVSTIVNDFKLLFQFLSAILANHQGGSVSKELEDVEMPTDRADRLLDDVRRLYGEGCDNVAIAEELGISLDEAQEYIDILLADVKERKNMEDEDEEIGSKD